MGAFNYLGKVFSNFLSNIHSLGKHRLEEDAFKTINKTFDIINNEISLNQIRKMFIEFYFEINKEVASEYSLELKYLRKQSDIPMIPYEQNKTIDGTIYAEYDSQEGLPFVLHRNKRLYFPKHWTLQDAKKQYRYFIERENLLGGNFTTKAPHQYQSDTFRIEAGDILLDIGSAEGLVALDSIESTKKTILYESDPIWFAPLKATFKPYMDKVEIINKLVGDKDGETSITLTSSLREFRNDVFFVKMDIEGAEELVIKGNADFFKTNKIKAACCTYHNVLHYKNLKETFESWGYTTSSSDGYILCFMDKVFSPPYFRKGLIRATNIK